MTELMNKIAGTYGQPFQKDIYEPGLKDLKANFVVTINGYLMGQLNGLDTQLHNNDNIIVMSLMTGG